MAKQTVNIGAAANDGTGDPIRDAFDKLNQNFDEVYSSYAATGSVSVGNSTVNSVVSNTGGLVVSNSTVSTVANSSIFKIGNTTANATLSSTVLTVAGNSTIGTSSVNTTALAMGNSTVNSSLSQSILTISTAAANLSVNSSVLSLGNSTVNTVANSTQVKAAGANLTSNTLLLGSGSTGSSVGSANFANGYSRLPNGLLMQFGYIAAVNSTANVTTFASVGGVAFVNTFSVSVTSTNSTIAVAAVLVNSSAIVLEANSASNTGAYWTAIGK